MSHRVGQTASELAGRGKWIPVQGILGTLVVCGEIYSGIRGRFDRNNRASAVQFMTEQAFLNGDYQFPAMWFWSKRDRRDAREQIKEALRLGRERDQWFVAMSDQEMRAYAGGNAQLLGETIRPLVELDDRRN